MTNLLILSTLELKAVSKYFKGLEIDAQQKDILEKYLENNFHMNAAEKPAIYVQGFRDALKLLLKLDLI